MKNTLTRSALLLLSASCFLGFAKPPKHTPTPTPTPSPVPTATATPTPTATATPTPSVTATPTPSASATPTATASATATPSATATVTATATATATATPTPSSLKAPHGIIDLSNQGWGNAAMNGVRVRIGWSDVQPTRADAYDWTLLDAAVAQAQKTGKQLGISVAMLADAPGWLTAQAKTYPLPATPSGHERSIVLPWDPVVQGQLTAFIAALGARYDGKANYVAMGGLGDVIESYITPNPADIGLTMSEAVANWTASCNVIIAAHAAAFKTTPFIFTAAKPYSGPEAVKALQEVVNAAAAKYGSHFGVMDCSLSAQSNTGYVPHLLVQQLSGAHPTGLQFLTSSSGFGGHELNGTVEETLAAATSLGAHFVEIYPADAEDPANAEMLKAAGAKLAP